MSTRRQRQEKGVPREPFTPARKTQVQRAAVNSAETAPPIVQDVLSSPGQALDSETRAFMEPRFGHDFSGVRVHTDERAAESARAVNALAYTVGQDVAFDKGRYSPDTVEGKRLLAHELTHVVQQNEAKSAGLGDLRMGVPGDASEREADTLAAQSIQSSASGLEGSEVRNKPLQTTISASIQQLQGFWPFSGQQCSNLDDAVRQWITPKYFEAIINEFSSALTDAPPTITHLKLWKIISNDDQLDMDIFFRRPGSTEEQHVKLIVRTTTVDNKTIALASLYDWLGPIPVEFRHWEGVVEQHDDTCVITDRPAPPPASSTPRYIPGSDEGESDIA
jgi:uncharacterized protein DUF4157